MGQMLVSPSLVRTGGNNMSFAAGIPIIGDILGYFSNRETNAANAQAVADTNAANLKISQNTNAMNQAINEQNIALTREQNAINREREDDAVRRRANDLVGAGLSKTLAAGNPASANAMQAPQATEAMVTGHQMQAARRNAYSFDNIATAGKMVQESILANKELEIRNKELDVRLQELNEQSRHNKASEATASRSVDVDERYLDQQDKWNQMYYDQNSLFHDDAVKLEKAKNKISYLQYVSQDSQREIQNLWYQSEIDFRQHTTEQNAMRLTADLAESTARVASFYANISLTNEQIEYVRSQIPYVAALTAESLAREANLNQDTENLLKDYMIKEWNLSVVQSEGTTTSSSVPSATEVQQLKKNRIASYVQKGLSTGLSVGAGVFLGSGGGKYIQKMLGFDDNPFRAFDH